MRVKPSLSNVATIGAVVAVSTVSSLYLLYHVRRKLEDREAFNALISQLTCVEIPITKLTFFDLAENRTQDIIAIEEKYKVRVKLQLGALPESGNEAVVVSGFQSHVLPASSEVRTLVAEVSAIVTCLIRVPPPPPPPPTHDLPPEFDLKSVLAPHRSCDLNDGYDLNAVVNTSTAALVDQEGGGVCSSSKSEEAVELCLTGTQSQVNFTRELIVSSAVQFYRRHFSVAPCVERSVGSLHDVYVSAVTSLHQFWVQVLDHSSPHSLDELQDALCAQSQELLPLASDVTQVMCAAPYVEDPSSYYRARVVACLPNPPNDVAARECTVEYVDYGDQSQVLYSQLRQLKPEFCTLPAQALECCLHGAASSHEQNPEENDDDVGGSLTHSTEVDKFKQFVHFNEWIPVKMLIVDKQLLPSDESGRQKTRMDVKLFDKHTNLEITVDLLRS